MPRISITAGSLLVMIALAALGFLYFWNRKAIAQSVQAVGAAINPTADTNLAYRAASAVTSAATGTNDSFGGWLAEKFSPSVAAANAMLATPVKSTVAPDTFDPYAINPLLRN